MPSRMLQLLLALWLWGGTSAAMGRPADQPYGEESAQADLRQAASLLEPIPVTELLGPLAPVALSPFFGLACLSGATLLVNQGVLPDNPLLRGNPALNHPGVFVAFLILALATSLPRLSKVSKPLAQMLDLVETYAGIVAVLVIQWAGQFDAGGTPVVVVSAGFFSTGVDIVLMAVSVLNILVIHSVRFFFEMMILLSPIPLVDALFETLNKAACAGLMALYALSPAAAFAVNLVVLLVCLCLFGWAHRRTGYLKAIALTPLWNWLRQRTRVDASAAALPDHLRKRYPRAWLAVRVFPDRAVDGLRPYTECWLIHDGDRLLAAPAGRWARARAVPLPDPAGTGRMVAGLLAHAIEWPGADKASPRWLFSRAYDATAGDLARALELRWDGQVSLPGGNRLVGLGRSLREGVQKGRRAQT